MIALFFLSFLLFIAKPTFGMEQPPATEPIAANNDSLITLEDINHKIYKIPKSHLEQSSTLKEMLSETGGDDSSTLPVPPPLNASFDLLHPYFDLAYKETHQQPNQRQNITFVHNSLNGLTDAQLLLVFHGFNYLNIPVVTDQALNLLSVRFSTPQNLAVLLNKDSKELPTTNDCKKLIAQGMLGRMPELRNYLQKKAASSKQLPTATAALEFPQARTHAINSDATKIATAIMGNFNIFIADAYQGYETSLKGHDLAPRSLEFSRDNSQLVSSSKDRTIRVWNLSTNTLAQTIYAGEYYRKVCFNHDGTLIASADRNDVCFWNSKTGLAVKNCIKSNTLVQALCFNHDGTKIATASDGQGIRISDVETGQLTSATQTPQGLLGKLTGISFNTDSSLIAIIDNRDNITLFDPPTSQTQISYTSGSSLVLPAIFLGNALRFTDATTLAAFTQAKMKKIQVIDPQVHKWLNAEILPAQVALLNYMVPKHRINAWYDYHAHIALPSQVDAILRPPNIRWGLANLLTPAFFGTLRASLGYKALPK